MSNWLTEIECVAWGMMLSGKGCTPSGQEHLVKKADAHIQRLEARMQALEVILRETVDLYGKPGGPWNVPGDPGGWLSKARALLEEKA